jgi:N-acetylglucosamine transport system substrate-binding protein
VSNKSDTQLSRRTMLRGLTMGSVAALAAACTPQAAAPAAPAADKPAADKPVESAKAVEPTKVVEPTSAPAMPSIASFEANNKAQWSRIPASYKPGTLIKEVEWKTMLGDIPAEPITVAGFKGGWGEAWIDTAIEQMKKDYPGIKIEKDFDPRIWEKMKPRLVAGEIPDWNYLVVGPWGGEWQKGVEEKLLMPLDFMLDVESYGVPGKSLREMMRPGTLESANGGLVEAQYTMPMTLSAYGIFYNATMFEKNGWPQPDSLTWEEFMDLCKKIKASGVAPFTYAGKYPGYLGWMLDGLWYKTVGDQGFCDTDNLVEGAWLQEGRVWGLEQIQGLFKSQYIFSGSEAMTHTESQQIFVDGKCAMIPNGSWMPNEQKETTPKDFVMKFSGIPAPKNGKGFAKAIALDTGASELNVGNGKNPLWGMEIMRHVYSPQVQQIFASQIGTPMALGDVVKDVKTTPIWDSVIAAVKAADGKNIISRGGSWYPELGKKWSESQGDIFSGKISAKDGLALLERGSRETRDNPDIKKLKRECK